MFESLFEMVREKQKRPDGPSWNVDEAWRLDVIRRMESMDPPMSRAQLARECDVTPSAITLLLGKPIKKLRGCRFLPKLEKALGVVRTTQPAIVVEDTDAWRRVQKILHDLNPRERDNWIATGELLAAKH